MRKLFVKLGVLAATVAALFTISTGANAASLSGSLSATKAVVAESAAKDGSVIKIRHDRWRSHRRYRSRGYGHNRYRSHRRYRSYGGHNRYRSHRRYRSYGHYRSRSHNRYRSRRWY